VFPAVPNLQNINKITITSICRKFEKLTENLKEIEGRRPLGRPRCRWGYH
jgi:hypothetical protein